MIRSLGYVGFALHKFNGLLYLTFHISCFPTPCQSISAGICVQFVVDIQHGIDFIIVESILVSWLATLLLYRYFFEQPSS